MINGTEKILVCCGTGCIANGALGVAVVDLLLNVSYVAF